MGNPETGVMLRDSTIFLCSVIFFLIKFCLFSSMCSKLFPMSLCINIKTGLYMRHLSLGLVFGVYEPFGGMCFGWSLG